MELGIDQVTPEFVYAMHQAGTRMILWGGVGIGKTDICSALAKHMTQLAKATDPDHSGWELRDKVVSHMPPEEISGLQIVDREKRQSFATRPAFMGDADKRYVLLLDEYTRAPQSYRNTLLQFLLSGAMGEHKMHKDSVIILASNSSADDITGLHRLSYADRSRIVHINVHTNFDIWSRWAAKKGVHPFVVGYLGNNSDKLETEPTEASNEAFACPRTWKMVSDILWSPYFLTENTVQVRQGNENVARGTGQFVINPGTRVQLQVAVNGAIGSVAAELFAYMETLANLPSPQEILDKKWFPEKDFGLQYAAIASTAGWLSRKTLKQSKTGSNDEADLVVVPTNLTNSTFMKYVDFIDTVKKSGRADMRLMAVRLLFKGLGFYYPNRPWNQANPTVLDHYIGEGKSREERLKSEPYRVLRALIDEFIQYYRDN
jgi:hypothetical protein